MKHCDPFNFNFGIKFVNVNGGDNNLTIAQTGDALGWIIAAVLAIIAIGAFAFYAAKKRNAKMNISSQIASHAAAAKASVASSISSKIILCLAVVALACSGIAFASQTVKAFAEGSTPVIKAVVGDDGSISVKPIHLTNAKNTDIKFVCTTADLWGEQWGDATLGQSIISMDFAGQSLYNSVPDGHEQLNDDIVNRIPQGEAADIAVNISNLDGEYAKSLIGSTVYYCGFKFEDAVVPVPSHTDYFIYNNEWFSTLDTEVTDDSPYYWDTASQYHEKEACDRVPEDDDTLTVPADDPVPGDPIPYLATLKLKNGYVWEAFDEVDPDTGVSKRIAPGVDPYTWEWVIDQRAISIEWAPDTTSLVYDGKAHPPIPRLGNAAEPQVLSASFMAFLPGDEPDVTYIKGGFPGVECNPDDVVDVDFYQATVNSFKVAPDKGEPSDPDLVKNYKLQDNTFHALQITPKELGVIWDAVDAYHEYDSAPYTPECTLDGICTRPEKGLDTVSLTYTYSKFDEETGDWVVLDAPTQVGTYKAEIALDLTQDDETFCYSLPENCSFEFQIDPVPGDSLLINWPKTTEYVATQGTINPVPTSVKGLKGDDQENIANWTYTYKEINAEGDEEEVDPAASLKSPGKYVVYAEPKILDSDDVDANDVTSCYRFNEDQKVYTFEVVKPSFKLDWSGNETPYVFDNQNHKPTASVTPVNWPDNTYESIDADVDYYDADGHEYPFGTDLKNVGSYTAKVSAINVYYENPTTTKLQFPIEDCEVVPEGSDTFNFEITPATLNVTWTNSEPEKKSTDYKDYAHDQVFDYIAHGKVATLVPATTVSGFDASAAAITYAYYTVNGMSESEMTSGNLPLNAGNYKAAIDDWTPPAGMNKTDFVIDPADSCLYYNITKRPFTGIEVTLKADPSEYVAHFEDNTYEYDDQDHFPLIDKLTESIEYGGAPVDIDLAATDYYISSPQEKKSAPGNYSMSVQSALKNYETGIINVPWSIASYESSPKLYYRYEEDAAVETNDPTYTLYISPVKVPGFEWKDGTESLTRDDNPPNWITDAGQTNKYTKKIEILTTKLNTKIMPTRMHQWFLQFIICNRFIGIENIDTSNVVDMFQLFSNFGSSIDDNASALQTLDFSSWDTSKVEDFSIMFSYSRIVNLDITSFDFSSYIPKGPSEGFLNLGQDLYSESLKFNLKNFKDPNLGPVFNTPDPDEDNLKFVDITGIDTSKIENMVSLFQGRTKLKTIKGLEDLSFESCTMCPSMFQGCESLEAENIGKNWSIDCDTCLISGMFSGCKSLKSVDLSGFKNYDTWDNNHNILTGCDSLESVTVSDVTAENGLEYFDIENAHTDAPTKIWYNAAGVAQDMTKPIPAGTYYYERPDVEPNVVFDELKNIPADDDPTYYIEASVYNANDDSLIGDYHLSDLQSGLSIGCDYYIKFTCPKSYQDMSTGDKTDYDEPTVKYIYDGGFELLGTVDSSDTSSYTVNILGNDDQPRVFAQNKKLHFSITYNEKEPVEIISLYYNGHRYWPVFPDNAPPANVTFYKDEYGHEPIAASNMSDLKGVKSYSLNSSTASFNAVTYYTMAQAWNNVYEDLDNDGIGTPKPAWISDKLASDETLESLLNTPGVVPTESTYVPEIKTIPADNIIESYQWFTYWFASCAWANDSGMPKAYEFHYDNSSSKCIWINDISLTETVCSFFISHTFSGASSDSVSENGLNLSSLCGTFNDAGATNFINNASFNIYDVDLPEGEDEITDNENWWNEASEVYVYAENKNEEAFTSNIYAVVQHADGTVTKEYITKDGQPIEVKGDDQTEVCTWTVPEDAVAVMFVYGEIPSDVPADAPAGTPEYYGGSAVEPEDTRGMSEGVAQAPSRVVETPDSNDITIF